jgi:hypothetical protein
MEEHGLIFVSMHMIITNRIFFGFTLWIDAGYFQGR